jgi:hypothetical protein
MTNYLLIYHGAFGPMPDSQEEIDRSMKAWMDWFGSLGDAVVDGGNPVGKSKTINPDGSVENHGGPDPASGYSVLRAGSIEEVIEKAKGCPHLKEGGTIEVAPIIAM